ncbi:aminotransferase class I/II-fold pyridoxal phosphate-dependent enzyme [Blastococcus sp. TML/M2B]|uniref:aminotransferase class I/II-fold pyridoxal phosphate-dependent enzyme n=1 Tax=unclassified Blastococcus TaxID=2619396 RepID=UPI00190DAE7D|nr:MULTISPECIES: aminotransferase class I/II-fold pyridoxal phosphate-dependent enzyme [unclassified Blastococcus]MBN1091279.1 aminotransferase class I/II-fold pyridoxal phosphate-dependent enzyme [Blastococcus sp. TML/M2B]MBN1095163.1 aminotransferase class I/II-fold pyridoxal phosphate-dependent enzyme [Blastococcus sp. TML/C7B]
MSAAPARTRILLSSPDVGDREQELVAEAIASGWIAPLGPMVDAFEQRIAERCGRAHAVALSSGTAALHLGLLELGARPGTAVVVPTLTFAATANAVAYCGAEPVFVDCDPENGLMSPALLDDALRALRAEGTPVAAVVPVDLLGRCADYTALAEVCARYDVPIVSDAAEALGAFHGSAPAGSFGAVAALSFNGNKIMTTSGGGMLLTDDGEMAARVRYLSTQARQPAVHYEHTEIGYNYRLSNVLAALGLAQLERLDGMIGRRRALRERYAAIFTDVPGARIFQREGDAADNCWLTAVLVDPAVAGWSAEDLRAALDAADIESRPLWKPMHRQPVFAGARSFLDGSADRLFATGLTLPSGSALTGDQVNAVTGALGAFLGLR